MPEIRVSNLSKRFAGGGGVYRASLQVPASRLTCVVGPSGSGKTTFLRLLAGLLMPDEGEIYIGERPITRLSANERNASMVFQSPRLLPHLTVAANIALPLTIRDRDYLGLAIGRVAASRLNKVMALAASLRIEHLMKRMPHELSGGEAQRVSLARALAADASYYLFDEPLASVDEQQREEFAQLLATSMESMLANGRSVIYVTHDLVEARSIGDFLVVLMNGSIVQADTPQRVYSWPATIEVAEFFTASGLITLAAVIDRVFEKHVRVYIDALQASLNVASERPLSVGTPAILGFRQAYLATSDEPLIVGPIKHVRDLGDHLRVRTIINGQTKTVSVVRPADGQIGERAFIAIRPSDAILIPGEEELPRP